MTTVLSRAEMEEIREAFDLFEDEGNLRVDRIEGAMKSLGRNPSQEDIANMMTSCGMDDGVGAVDFAQFLAIIAEDFNRNGQRETSREKKEQIEQVFGLFDQNDDGHIDVSELSRIMVLLGEQISEQDVQKMIREADLDGDGKVSLEEFLTMMECK